MKSPRPAGAALQGDPFSLADLQRAIDIWPTNEDREDRIHAAVLHAGMPDESADPPGPTMFTLEEIYLKLVETQEDVQATQSQLQSVQQDVQAAQSLLQSVEERLAAAGIGAPPGMSLIPAGPFQMGDNYRVEGAAGPVHTVNISAFYMDKFQVTNEDMRRVMQWAYDSGLVGAGTGGVTNLQGNARRLLNLSVSTAEIQFDAGVFTVTPGRESFPVVWVSWYGAMAFCNYFRHRHHHQRGHVRIQRRDPFSGKPDRH